jgi:hypothetical protein
MRHPAGDDVATIDKRMTLRSTSAEMPEWMRAGLAALGVVVASCLVAACAGPILPAVHVANDTDAPVVFQRVDRGATVERTLAPGTGFTARGADNPFIRGVRGRDWRDGEELLYEVRDRGGVVRGRIALSVETLRGRGAVTLCLSTAADPPYQLDSAEQVDAMVRMCGRVLISKGR